MTTKPRILYVDDERSNLTSFKYMFRKYYDIHIAENTKEADGILQEKDIQLIISDQRMPGETGVEFLARIKLPRFFRILPKYSARYPPTGRVFVASNDVDKPLDILEQFRIDENRFAILSYWKNCSFYIFLSISKMEML